MIKATIQQEQQENKRTEFQDTNDYKTSWIYSVILTVIMESSLTSDSSWSSNQRTDASGAGFANPVVSNNIWSSLQ